MASLAACSGWDVVEFVATNKVCDEKSSTPEEWEEDRKCGRVVKAVVGAAEGK